jgi:hypothetical protein
MTDEEITLAAREICARKASKGFNSDHENYMSGKYDDTIWMRLVELGILRGLEGQANALETAKREWEAIDADDTEGALADWALEWGDVLLSAAIPQLKTNALKKLQEALGKLIIAVEFEVPPILNGVDVEARCSILLHHAKEARKKLEQSK